MAPYGRERAVWALGRLGDARAVEPLIACQHDPDEQVRKCVLLALADLGDTRAVEPLIACLKDRKWSHRRSATEALGKLGAARALGPLAACLNDPNMDMDVREGACKAIMKLGKPAVGSLIKADMSLSIISLPLGVRHLTGPPAGLIAAVAIESSHPKVKRNEPVRYRAARIHPPAGHRITINGSVPATPVGPPDGTRLRLQFLSRRWSG
jgi:hypothetical protein